MLITYGSKGRAIASSDMAADCLAGTCSGIGGVLPKLHYRQRLFGSLTAESAPMGAKRARQSVTFLAARRGEAREKQGVACVAGTMEDAPMLSVVG